jgi:hypothetical protein
MQDLIKQKLVEFHATCDVDKWGQKGTLSMYEVFGKDMHEIRDYVKKNKGILNVCTYSSRFGQYEGIWEIVDADIKAECTKAFEDNPNRKLAMTR